MFEVFDIFVKFWYDLIIGFNNSLNNYLIFDLADYTFNFFNQSVSLLDLAVLISSVLSLIFLIYITYKFIRFILSLFSVGGKK